MRTTALFAVALTACGITDAKTVIKNAKPADLTDPAVVSSFAVGSDPAMLYELLVAIANPTGTTCPAIESSPRRLIVRGGCTTEQGARVFGSIETELDDAAQPTRVVWNDYGSDGPVTCEKTKTITVRTAWNGSMTRTNTADGYTLKIDFATSGISLTSADECQTAPNEAAVQITGSVNGPSKSDYTANAEGTLVLNGRNAGVKTEAIRVTRATCLGEPLSGKTTLTTPEHTAIVDYDGATACEATNDEEPRVRWSLDGVDKGTMPFKCSAASPALYVWVLLAFIARRGARRARSQ